MLGYLEKYPLKDMTLASLGLSLVGIATSTSSVIPGFEVALTVGVSAAYVLASYTLCKVAQAGWRFWFPLPTQETVPEKTVEEHYKEGYDNGLTQGEKLGMTRGQNLGHKTGYELGHKNGAQEARPDAYAQGEREGYTKGYKQGSVDTHEKAYQEGYQDGCRVAEQSKELMAQPAIREVDLNRPFANTEPFTQSQADSDYDMEFNDYAYENSIQNSPQDEVSAESLNHSEHPESMETSEMPANPPLSFRNKMDRNKVVHHWHVADNLGHYYLDPNKEEFRRSQRLLAKKVNGR